MNEISLRIQSKNNFFMIENIVSVLWRLFPSFPLASVHSNICRYLVNLFLLLFCTKKNLFFIAIWWLHRRIFETLKKYISKREINYLWKEWNFFFFVLCRNVYADIIVLVFFAIFCKGWALVFLIEIWV